VHGRKLVAACLHTTACRAGKDFVSIIWRETYSSSAVELFHKVIVRKMAGRHFSLDTPMSANTLPR